MLNFFKKFCSSEGCTCFFNGNWKECCDMHDKRYEKKGITRLQADILLYRCVNKKNRFVAPFIFIGVRIGGWYFY